MATDFGCAFDYTRVMPRKPLYPSPPATEMNQWVRDALRTCGMTQQELADRLTAHPDVSSYDKSMVNKMTKKRKISAVEARAISDITGYPVPPSKESEAIIRELAELSAADREAVLTLIRNLASRPENGR